MDNVEWLLLVGTSLKAEMFYVDITEPVVGTSYRNFEVAVVSEGSMEQGLLIKNERRLLYEVIESSVYGYTIQMVKAHK